MSSAQSAARWRTLARGPSIPAALAPRHFGPDPVLELMQRVLLGPQHPAGVGQGMQAALIHLADHRILTTHDIGELDRLHDVAIGVRERLGEEEKLDTHLRLLPSEWQQHTNSTVIHMANQAHRR